MDDVAAAQAVLTEVIAQYAERVNLSDNATFPPKEITRIRTDGLDEECLLEDGIACHLGMKGDRLCLGLGVPVGSEYDDWAWADTDLEHVLVCALRGEDGDPETIRKYAGIFRRLAAIAEAIADANDQGQRPTNVI